MDHIDHLPQHTRRCEVVQRPSEIHHFECKIHHFEYKIHHFECKFGYSRTSIGGSIFVSSWSPQNHIVFSREHSLLQNLHVLNQKSQNAPALSARSALPPPPQRAACKIYQRRETVPIFIIKSKGFNRKSSFFNRKAWFLRACTSPRLAITTPTDIPLRKRTGGDKY